MDTGLQDVYSFENDHMRKEQCTIYMSQDYNGKQMRQYVGKLFKIT